MRAAGRLLLPLGGVGRRLAPPPSATTDRIFHHPHPRRSASTSTSTSPDAATAAAAAAAAAAKAAPGAIWLPLPRLAPHMTTGRVRAWLKREGEAVACYELIAEVASDNLVEAAHRVGRFAGEVPLWLESQEEGFLAKVVVEGGWGRVFAVGTPIAVLCEEEDEIGPITEGLAALPPATLHSLDLYHPEAQRLLRVCNWQAYLKDPPPEGDGGCGCG